MKIYVISGFLGLPHDWDFLKWKQLTAVDGQSLSWNSLTDWGQSFNTWIANQKKEKRILMGYSLGGRLALHALINQPHLWQAAVIISAHIGLPDFQARQQRIKHDQMWAKRFEYEDWKTLMQDWNAQSIFAHETVHPIRRESDYQRSYLMHALIKGSLGNQAYLRKQIEEFPFPILWITGNQDTYLCQIAQSLKFTHPNSKWINIKQAGHRVPWSQPNASSDTIIDFLQKI